MNRNLLKTTIILAILAVLLVITPFPSTKDVFSMAAGDNLIEHWNLADIYSDLAAWEKDFKDIKETEIPKYKGFQGKLGDETKFLEVMKMDDHDWRIMDKLVAFSNMKRDEDNTNSQNSEMVSRSDALYSELDAASSYFRPELLALPEDTLQSFIKNEQLKEYRVMLKNILEAKPHTLSSAEEAILAKVGNISDTASTLSTKIREADLKFPQIKDPEGNMVDLSEALYFSVLYNPDRTYRELAFNSILNTYGSMKNSLAAALDAQMRADLFFAGARKYKNSLEASLMANQIPVSVYTSLLDTTAKNIDVLHKFVSLRKNVLGLDKIRYYDLYVPVVEKNSIQKYPYSDTQAILAKSLKPLGEDYIQTMQSGFNNRWIDVYPAPNKTSGAYSWGTYDTHPYILANYDDSLDSLLTIAHEMGHAMAGFYTNKLQPYSTSYISIFTNEIASTTNELLTLRYLISQAKNDSEKLFYLDRLAEDFRQSFFAQIMYAEFELKIHERVENGEALSVKSLNQLWGDLVIKYYGPDFELTEEAKLGWSRIPHFFYNFYVYQYATGIAAASQFSIQLISGAPGAAEKYRKFLEAGGSDTPTNILNSAGVDMLSGAPVQALFDQFNQTMEEMRVILKK